MHDEASAHYVSMIDQTTLGHRFLKEELNYLPRVGWQIDPFGHSSTHAWLSSEVGFDALFFGRIDYQDHNKRMADQAMEMVCTLLIFYNLILPFLYLDWISESNVGIST